MCDLHSNCPTVTMLEKAAVKPSADDGSALPPGFMTLSEEEYRKIIRQCPIEKYYEVAETPISTGQWSSVYQCHLRSTGARFVAKFCNKLRMDVPAVAEIVHEVAALRHCRRCPRIVQLYEVFETEDQYVLVMELGSGGDLQGILDDNQVPYESDVIRFMRHLLEGLVFIHERNLAHLDIKPQNLVLTGEFPDCEVKLCDLEISRVITANTEVREMLGTPDYVAPEILRFDPVCLTSDIWSVGVLAYVLLTGFTPFGGDTDTETFRNISRAELDFPDELFEDVSELAKDFIRRCLVKDPQGRLSARQSLMHPWLQQPEAAARVPSVHGSAQSILSQDGFGSQDSVRTLRRSASKSREVLCEKVTNSQLKKNISKSRERLCDLKFGLSKSRERLARTVLAGGVSRSSEVLGSRPPWRAAGLNCPLGTPLPPPMERMGSFKVRDQYQSQVVAGLGSSQSLNITGQPFVRHCSLRGRKKSSPPSAEPTDFRASLRRNKKSNGRRSSLQMDSRSGEEERQRDQRRRSHSTRDEPELSIPRLERRRDSHGRRELSVPPPDEGKNMIIVEIISDDDEKDVFTRLYNDHFKDSDLKWRKLRDTDYDDEKENKSSNNSSQLGIRRPRIERSRSRDSNRSSRSSNKGGSGSDETLSERIENLESLKEMDNPNETRDMDHNSSQKNIFSGTDCQQAKDDVFAGEEEEKTITNSESSEKTSDEERSSSESLQIQSPETETTDTQTAMSESVSVDSPQLRRNCSDSEMTSKTEEPTSTDEPSPEEPAQTQESSIPEEPSTSDMDTGSRQSSVSPERRIEPYLDQAAEPSAPWRRQSDQLESPQRWRRPASSSPEPGAEPRRRRQGSTSVTTERSVNTDAVPTRDRGINTDAVLLSAVQSDGAPRWERAEALPASTPAPAVTTLRDVFERGTRAGASFRRHASVPPPTAAGGLARSPTDEDVPKRRERTQRSERSRSDADTEKRSVAFAETDAPSRKSSAGCYRRCSSLSSDLGSSEVSSEAGSESYCVLSWEEAASDQATELKPVVSTRSSGRPRSQSQQLAQLELAKLRQRGRSHSVVSEPFSAAQPWGPLCSGSVARAFEKFHSMAGDSRKRRQSSPNIVGLAAKVTDMGEL